MVCLVHCHSSTQTRLQLPTLNLKQLSKQGETSDDWPAALDCHVQVATQVSSVLLIADWLQWKISGQFVCSSYSGLLGNDKRQKVVSLDFEKRLQQADYKHEYIVLPLIVFIISGVDVRSQSAIHMSIDSRHLRSQTSQHCKCLGTTLWLPCKVA